jgi:hypothetical protein
MRADEEGGASQDFRIARGVSRRKPPCLGSPEDVAGDPGGN